MIKRIFLYILFACFAHLSFGQECSDCGATGWSSEITVGQAQSYSVPAEAGATYIWTASGSITIVSGQGTNEVLVSGTAGSGKLCVIRYKDGQSACANCIDLTVTEDFCENLSMSFTKPQFGFSAEMRVYSVDNPTPGMTYQWEASGDISIFSQSGSTATIAVRGVGELCLRAFMNGVEVCKICEPVTLDPCEDLAISETPSTESSTISTFSVDNPVAGVTYVWETTGGATIISQSGSNAVVQLGGDGTVCVRVFVGTQEVCSLCKTVTGVGIDCDSLSISETPSKFMLGVLEYQLDNTIQLPGVTYLWEVSSGATIVSQSGPKANITVEENGATVCLIVFLDGEEICRICDELPDVPEAPVSIYEENCETLVLCLPSTWGNRVRWQINGYNIDITNSGIFQNCVTYSLKNNPANLVAGQSYHIQVEELDGNGNVAKSGQKLYTPSCVGGQRGNTIDINIFPNPAVNQFIINTTGSVETSLLYGQDGNLVKQVQGQDATKISTAGLNKGIYYLKVKVDGKWVSKKVLVE